MSSLISPDDLRRHIDQREQQRGGRFSCDLRQYSAAMAVIRHFFGQDWINDRLNVRTGDQYVRLDEGVEGDRLFHHQDRVTELGELLFNMQGVAGFEAKVRKLRANTLESTIAELEGARFIHSTTVRYRFVQESSVRGCDYDIEIADGELVVACEVKAKIDGSTPSAKAVKNRLNRAREQLPRHSPGLIFIKIPSSWSSDAHCWGTLDEGVAWFFRGTGRIAAVFALWHQWVLQPPGAFRATCVRHWENTGCRIDVTSIVREIIETAGTSKARWTDLWSVVCDGADKSRRIAQDAMIRRDR